jgi:hypothetical protein
VVDCGSDASGWGRHVAAAGLPTGEVAWPAAVGALHLSMRMTTTIGTRRRMAGSFTLGTITLRVL